MVNGIEVEEPHSPEFRQAQRISGKLLDMGLMPYRAELSMYNKRLDCAGQADLIMEDSAGRKVIVDWKRVRKLQFDNKYNQLRYPFSHLPDCNGILYSMQLSTYAFFLEDGYGMPVRDDMYLAVCHPENPEPTLIRVQRMRAEIDALVEYESPAM